MWKLRQRKLMKKLSLVYLSDFSTWQKLFSFQFRKFRSYCQIGDKQVIVCYSLG
jgi:hypothetical protein